MNRESSEKILRAIGAIDDDKIKKAEKHLKNKATFDSGNVITVNVSQATPVPVKRTRFSAQFVGLAAAVLLLVFGSVAALHFLSPDRVVGPGGGTESQSTQLPPNTPHHERSLDYTVIEWWCNGDEDEKAMQERIDNSEHHILIGTTLALPEFPDVVFEWVYSGWENGEMINYIKAVYPNGDEKTVVSGFGLGWGGRVYIADILGNGSPQLIFETSMTSGLFTNNVHVHDFINDEHYFLSGYGTANVLSVENGRIMVTQHNTFVDDAFPEGAGGELAFANGELTIIGGQRMDSTDFGGFDSDEEYAHDHDLEESGFSARAWDLPNYYLRTNSTRITVSVPRGGNGLGAEVFLYDIEYPDVPIQTFVLERGNRKSFTGLTSARNYFIVVNGVDDDMLITVTQ
jgi:hypothetical protein